ncbi:MAG: hypothetical protein HOM11_08145 [Methylococcales bacterium]|jgi:hypothetical protein|nr:hypothetical protein [Methylococcales bacterium]MBT7445125.1 hypothetical protein [Methylococcales bacterium]
MADKVNRVPTLSNTAYAPGVGIPAGVTADKLNPKFVKSFTESGQKSVRVEMPKHHQAVDIYSTIIG